MIVSLFTLELLHQKERERLYSRLMAQDLTEYMAFESKDAPRKKGRNFISRVARQGETERG